MRLAQAATIVRERRGRDAIYYAFPREHWRCLRTNNVLERIMREIRRRTRVVGNFPDGKSALMLVAARLRHVAGTKWGTQTLSADEPAGRSDRSHRLTRFRLSPWGRAEHHNQQASMTNKSKVRKTLDTTFFKIVSKDQVQRSASISVGRRL